jgi:pentatricopeptide repeat protein
MRTATAPAPTTQAVAVFDACPRLGVQPNSHIYSALVSACSTAGRWGDALRHFEAARAAGAANEITYSAAIAACMRSNELDRGLQLLQDMQNEGLTPDSITFCTLLLAAQRCERTLAQTHTSVLTPFPAGRAPRRGGSAGRGS